MHRKDRDFAVIVLLITLGLACVLAYALAGALAEWLLR